MASVVKVPCKVIIAGEHSVCYGQPAVVVALSEPSLTVKLTLDTNGNKCLENENSEKVVKFLCEQCGGLDRDKIQIEVNSSIPLGAGLGSSAAFCVACAAAIASVTNRLDRDFVFKAAHKAEQILHGGRSSGVDVAPCVYGGMCLYTMADGMKEHVAIYEFPVNILLVYTNVGRNTSKLNGLLENAFNEQPVGTELIIRAIGEVTKDIWKVLNGSTFNFDRLKHYCTQCHCLLKSLGLSHPKLDQIVQIAEDHSAAAKLTGAGGGGSAVVFAEDKATEEELTNKFNACGFTVFPVKISNTGYQMILKE